MDYLGYRSARNFSGAQNLRYRPDQISIKFIGKLNKKFFIYSLLNNCEGWLCWFLSIKVPSLFKHALAEHFRFSVHFHITDRDVHFDLSIPYLYPWYIKRGSPLWVLKILNSSLGTIQVKASWIFRASVKRLARN